MLLVTWSPDRNLTSITSWNPETKAVSLPARCSGGERLSLCPARPQQVFLIHQSASVLLTVIDVIREPGKADDIQKCRDEGRLQQTSAFLISSTEISSDMLLNVLLYNPTEAAAQRERTSHTLPVCTGFCNLMYLFLYRSVQEKLFEAFIQISDADNLRVVFTCCSVQKKLSNFLPKFKAGR